MSPVTLDIDSLNFNFKNLNSDQKEIPFGEYIFQRILNAGTKSIFGVPGDFNLPLLEYLYEPQLIEQGLRWIGNCNELNAAYAADGYSRYSNKIGCLITTYGVGELSSLNGIAGAFAENSKILNIVGVSRSVDSRCSNFKTRNLHHLVPNLKNSNFDGPNHKVYYEMVKDKVCCSAEYLENINDACDQVDKVIMDIYKYSKPGYIFVPVDFVNMTVPIDNLLNRPTISIEDCIDFPSNVTLTEITKMILDRLYESRTPAIIGDVLTDRYGGNKMLNELIDMTQIWNFTTVNGKSIINESNPNYMGMYNGDEGPTSVKERFMKCDLVLNFGIDINEINHGHYSFNYKPNCKLIELHPDYIRFFDTANENEQLFKGVNFMHILTNLLNSIDVSQLDFGYDSTITSFKTSELNFKYDETSETITQNYLQHKFQDYLNPGDVLVCETGSIQFSIRDLVFPNQIKYISQGFFLSIGMALPASVGVGIAMQDFPKCHITDNESVPESYNPRLILFEGDGAAQMTVQELTSMIRFDIPIEIMLWNNNGYTIERAILGPTRSYNDIMPWKWTKLFEAFGDFDKTLTTSSVIETTSKLALKMKQLKKGDKKSAIELVEVKLETLDYPESLRHMVESAKVKKPTLKSGDC